MAKNRWFQDNGYKWSLLFHAVHFIKRDSLVANSNLKPVEETDVSKETACRSIFIWHNLS